MIAYALEGLAASLGIPGRPLVGARLAGAAAALREALGSPVFPVERDLYERMVGLPRAQADPAAWAAAWEEGRLLTTERAVAEALAHAVAAG